MNNFKGILKSEIHQIVYLQNLLQPIESALALISECMRPSMIYNCVIPIVGGFHAKMLVELIVAEIVSDYTGLILKWFLSEDRPFWWVRETDAFTDLTRPKLRQHELTCETTSGCPSGHNIVTTVFFYALFKHIARHCIKTYDCNKKICHVISAAGFISMSMFMWIIRMYFGCHFLHQCIAGSLWGYLSVKVLENDKIHTKLYNVSRKKGLIIAGAMAITVLSTYFGMKKLGIDPHWTVKMAFKWCENPQQISHESTPVHAIVKTLGALTGVCLSAPLKEKAKVTLDKWKSVPFAASLVIFNQYLLSQTPQNHGVFFFLGYSYSVHTAFTYALLSVLPKICSKNPNAIKED